MTKNKIIILTLGLVFLFMGIFEISYNVGLIKFTTTNNLTKDTSPDKLTLKANSESVVSPNAKIVFKIVYVKSGDVDTREGTVSDFAGKNKNDLESQGYEVESITNNQVVLVKNVDSYAPNKYILGVKGNCFAIYKTDANGSMYIENESTDITNIKVPTQGDYNLLIKGAKSFQCDTKEEVEEKLGEFSS